MVFPIEKLYLPFVLIKTWEKNVHVNWSTSADIYRNLYITIHGIHGVWSSQHEIGHI